MMTNKLFYLLIQRIFNKNTKSQLNELSLLRCYTCPFCQLCFNINDAAGIHEHTFSCHKTYGGETSCRYAKPSGYSEFTEPHAIENLDKQQRRLQLHYYDPEIVTNFKDEDVVNEINTNKKNIVRVVDMDGLPLPIPELKIITDFSIPIISQNERNTIVFELQRAPINLNEKIKKKY